MRPAHRWGLAAVATALIMLAPYAGHLRPDQRPRDRHRRPGDGGPRPERGGVLRDGRRAGKPRTADRGPLHRPGRPLRWGDPPTRVVAGQRRLARRPAARDRRGGPLPPGTADGRVELRARRGAGLHRPGDPAAPQRRPAAARGRAAGTRRGRHVGRAPAAAATDRRHRRRRAPDRHHRRPQHPAPGGRVGRPGDPRHPGGRRVRRRCRPARPHHDVHHLLGGAPGRRRDPLPSAAGTSR